MDNSTGAPAPSTNPPASEVNKGPTVVNMPTNNQPVLRSFSNNQQGATKKPFMTLVAIGLAVVFAGIATGWAIAKVEGPSTGSDKVSVKEGDLAADEAGLDDESMFEKDTPEGVLVEGGLDGEGTHHLDRGAGEDKKVYLTSSVINLDNFVGKKVRVWGNTIAAQHAPWLMDVGKIKVIE